MMGFGVIFAIAIAALNAIASLGLNNLMMNLAIRLPTVLMKIKEDQELAKQGLDFAGNVSQLGSDMLTSFSDSGTNAASVVLISAATLVKKVIQQLINLTPQTLGAQLTNHLAQSAISFIKSKVDASNKEFGSSMDQLWNHVTDVFGFFFPTKAESKVESSLMNAATSGLAIVNSLGQRSLSNDGVSRLIDGLPAEESSLMNAATSGLAIVNSLGQRSLSNDGVSRLIDGLPAEESSLMNAATSGLAIVNSLGQRSLSNDGVSRLIDGLPAEESSLMNAATSGLAIVNSLGQRSLSNDGVSRLIDGLPAEDELGTVENAGIPNRSLNLIADGASDLLELDSSIVGGYAKIRQTPNAVNESIFQLGKMFG